MANATNMPALEVMNNTRRPSLSTRSAPNAAAKKLNICQRLAHNADEYVQIYINLDCMMHVSFSKTRRGDADEREPFNIAFVPVDLTPTPSRTMLM